MLLELLVFAGVVAVIAAAAVWFGRRIIAPPLQRALDRADEDDEPGD